MDKYQRIRKIRESVSWIPVVNRIFQRVCYKILKKREDVCNIVKSYMGVEALSLTTVGYEMGVIWIEHPNNYHMDFFFDGYNKPIIGEKIDGYCFLGYLCYDGTICAEPKDLEDAWYVLWIKEQTEGVNEN